MSDDAVDQHSVAVQPSAGALSADLKLAVQEEARAILKRYAKLGAAAVAVLLSAIGIGSCWDAHRVVTSLVTISFDKLIHGESGGSVRRTLDHLLNRSIVTSYLIALRKPEPTPLKSDHASVPREQREALTLSVDEWTRLKKWVQDEKLEDQDFADALVILAAQEETRARQDAKEFLAEMPEPAEVIAIQLDA